MPISYCLLGSGKGGIQWAIGNRQLAIGPLLVALVCCLCSTSRASILDLNADWKFVRADRDSAQAVDFDDSSWQSITLPHTWNNLDGEDGGDNYYRGPGWYRRHLKLDSREIAGKSVFLKFDAASNNAEVFVNGKLVGSHRGMFAAFCFEITPMLNPSGDNVIAVRVTNGRDDTIPPLSADFTFFGGLYRGVHLLVLDPLSITPLDDASSGVYVKQEKVSADGADVEVTAKLRNGGADAKTAEVKCEILDAGGNTVGQAGTSAAVAAGGGATAVEPIHLDHPHLWNGRKDPYLYQVRVAVGDGQTVTDQATVPLGLRFFRVDPQQGFFLNGVSYPLHGVNRHQDRLDMGWAIGPAQQQEDFNLIMEMGCTGIRLSHYQHAQEFYDLCDRGGLVVWAEACLVNSVAYSRAFDDTVLEQLRELIKQNYNHPSICFWSLYNELGNGYRGSRQQVDTQNAHQISLVNRLNELAHELDPDRLTTAATSQSEPKAAINLIPDIIGFNRYDGWYSKTIADWPAELDAIHRALPDHSIAISEYGAGASVFQHDLDLHQPRPGGPWHPEEWQCLVHEAAWDAMRQRPWLWGTFLWNMFDFAADPRNEGDHAGRNDKGMVTYDRKTKKDVFYFYKANWSDDPFVYITDRRFTPRPAEDLPIKIYSNCDTVELRLNGQTLGARPAKMDHIFIWPNADLGPGANQFLAIGTRGGKHFSDQCTIVFDPSVKIPRPATEPTSNPTAMAGANELR